MSTFKPSAKACSDICCDYLETKWHFGRKRRVCTGSPNGDRIPGNMDVCPYEKTED